MFTVINISTNLAWLKSLSLPLSSPDTDTTRLLGANCLQKYHNNQLLAIWSWNDVYTVFWVYVIFWVYIYNNLYKVFIFGWFSWPVLFYCKKYMYYIRTRCMIKIYRSVATAGEKQKQREFFLLYSHFAYISLSSKSYLFLTDC